MSFEDLAKHHSLSLMKWDEDYYASENTQLANEFYLAGQQSKQEEIDRLVRELNLMRGWEKIAQINGENKRKYIDEINKLVEIINWQLENSDLILSVDVTNTYEKGYKEALLLIKNKLQRE